MQQTEQFGFHLIEAQDTFSTDPLNENMRLLDAALAKKGTCTVVTGSFTGDGTSGREITVGFAPAFLIAYGWNTGYSLSFTARDWSIRFRDGTFTNGSGIALTENGFMVGGYTYNPSGYITQYAAFA